MRITRYRLRALARPARRWAVGVVLATVTFTGVRAALARTEAARSAWGTRRAVAVAARDLLPGDRIDPAAVRPAAWPAALVADDALTPDELAARPAVALGVLAGEPVRRAHLAGGAGGATAGVAPGRRAVALPRPAGVALPPGTRVDVIDADAGAVVARSAVVVGPAGDAAVLVGVAEADAGAAARAAASGRAVLALTPDD